MTRRFPRGFAHYVINWLFGRVDRVLVQRNHRGTWAKSRSATGAQRQYAKIEADRLLKHYSVPKWDRPEEPRDQANKICTHLGQMKARPLVAHWFTDNSLSNEDIRMGETEIALHVGAAAAVITLVVLWLLRQGRTASLPGGDALSCSPDFSAILKLSEGRDEVASLAKRIRDRTSEPWSYSFVIEDEDLGRDERHLLLSRLSEDGRSNVLAIEPDPMMAFDAGRMSATREADGDSVWVVSKLLTTGFEIRETIIPAEVEIATRDYMVLIGENCPVGRMIRSRADDLMPGGNKGSGTWRATWGLLHPEDLREQFDEATLKAWRSRMIDGINSTYPGRVDRQLSLVGEPGAPFEESVMQADGKRPIGDSIVQSVALRDNIPQQGLACPGGNPLLLAVVNASPVVNS